MEDEHKTPLNVFLNKNTETATRSTSRKWFYFIPLSLIATLKQYIFILPFRQMSKRERKKCNRKVHGTNFTPMLPPYFCSDWKQPEFWLFWTSWVAGVNLFLHWGVFMSLINKALNLLFCCWNTCRSTLQRRKKKRERKWSISKNNLQNIRSDSDSSSENSWSVPTPAWKKQLNILFSHIFLTKLCMCPKGGFTVTQRRVWE